MGKEEKILKREIVFLLILVTAVFAARLPHMNDPLDRDEGVYAYTAARTYVGELPYRDVYDSNPPFIFYIYRAAFDLLGVSTASVRNFTTLYVILSALLIYMFARTFAGAAAAMLASLFYCVFIDSRITGGLGSNAEIFTNFTMVFSMFFLLDRDKEYEKANFYLSGFLMAAAFLTKIMMAFACVVPFVYILGFIKEKKSKFAGLIWYSAGFFSLIFLAMLWAVKNGIPGGANISYNIFYAALMEKTLGFGRTAEVMWDAAKNSLFLTAAFLYSATGLRFKKTGQAKFLLFMMSFSVIAGIIMFKDAHAQFYSALLPFLAISAGFMVKDAAKAVMKLRTGRAAAIAAVFMIAVAGVFQGAVIPGAQKKSVVERMISEEARSMGLQLKNTAADKESLFVWPDEPEIYFYSGIKCEGRFLSASPFGYYDSVFQGKLFEGLMASPPDYFVLQKNTDEIVFEKLLEKYYSKSMEGPNFVLYKKGGGK